MANKISKRLTNITQSNSKKSTSFWITFFTIIGIIAFSALAIIANILTLGLATVITGIVGAVISFIGFMVNWIKGGSSSQAINSKIKPNVNCNEFAENQHNSDEDYREEFQLKNGQKRIKNDISRNPFSKRDDSHESENNLNEVINDNSKMEDKEKELILKGHKLYKFYLDKISEYRNYKELVKNEPILIDALAKSPVAYTLYNDRKNTDLLKAILDVKPKIAEIIIGYHAETTSLDLLSFEEILLLTGKSFKAAKILLDDLEKGNLKNIRHLNDEETADLLYNIATVHGRYRYDFADSVLKIVEDILKNGEYKEHRKPYHEKKIQIKNTARQQKDRTICNIITNKV
ncbi:MAG: hypothetical protein GY820_19985 [Gammaproteobacteria bacterium]|nr:hypothetical protein [Gammaproteobacteria bacterium]